ncbi:unnamed protein product [Schistosoma curassoni]|nr:unnamed protein product [Schistosoma curassoni]
MSRKGTIRSYICFPTNGQVSLDIPFSKKKLRGYLVNRKDLNIGIFGQFNDSLNFEIYPTISGSIEQIYYLQNIQLI